MKANSLNFNQKSGIPGCVTLLMQAHCKLMSSTGCKKFMDIEEFIEVTSPVAYLLNQALSSNFIIPEFPEFCELGITVVMSFMNILTSNPCLFLIFVYFTTSRFKYLW